MIDEYGRLEPPPGLFTAYDEQEKVSSKLPEPLGDVPPVDVFEHSRGDEFGKPAEERKFEITSISSREFAKAEYRLEYLIRWFMVRSQPLVIAGPPKTLKTSIVIDLSVALSSGKDFLGHFKVEHAANVGIISGESGEATLQDTFRRVCECKHVNMEDQSIEWSFQVPHLSDPTWMRAIEEFIVGNELDVLIIDPVYLALLNEQTAKNASNVFSMGSVLRLLNEMVSKLGVTLILLHHTSKGAAKSMKQTRQPPELEDIAMAGFGEFARQWCLLGKRSDTDDGSGHHELWMRYGGSAGHGGLIGVDVREGSFKDMGGRRWAVTVRDKDECFEELQTSQEQHQSEKKAAQLEADMDKVRAVAERFKDGAAKSRIGDAVGMDHKKSGRILEALVNAGEWEHCEVQHPTNKQTFSGYKPTSTKAGGQTDNPPASG